MRHAIAYELIEKIGEKIVVHHVAYTQASGPEASEILSLHFPGGDPVRDRILAQMDRNGHTRAGLSAVSTNAPQGHEAGAVAAAGGPVLQVARTSSAAAATPIHGSTSTRKYREQEPSPNARGNAIPSGIRDTSRDAYSRTKVSGKLTQQQSLVMAAFDGKGYTRQELAARTGLGINCICGRVDEMVELGILRETEKRLCRVTKQNAMELQTV